MAGDFDEQERLQRRIVAFRERLLRLAQRDPAAFESVASTLEQLFDRIQRGELTKH